MSLREVVVVSDSPALREEVKSVLSSKEFNVRELSSGAQVLPAVLQRAPDLIVSDMQVGNMGGVAMCQDLRLEESGGRIGHVPVLLLLDRRPDVFLARRCNADGWIVKPLNPLRLRRAITAVIDGGIFADESYRPAESAVASPAVG